MHFVFMRESIWMYEDASSEFTLNIVTLGDGPVYVVL